MLKRSMLLKVSIATIKITLDRRQTKASVHVQIKAMNYSPKNNWKHTSFVVFIHHSQNFPRHNAMQYYLIADVVENMEFQNSIHLVLRELYRCIIILAQHIIASLLHLMFCINLSLI